MLNEVVIWFKLGLVNLVEYCVYLDMDVFIFI